MRLVVNGEVATDNRVLTIGKEKVSGNVLAVLSSMGELDHRCDYLVDRSQSQTG